MRFLGRGSRFGDPWGPNRVSILAKDKTGALQDNTISLERLEEETSPRDLYKQLILNRKKENPRPKPCRSLCRLRTSLCRLRKKPMQA